MKRQSPIRAIFTMIVVASLVFGTAPASAAVTKTWGWTTDTTVMSFFGGIPYRGCEKARLTVPNPGSTGTITASTYSSISLGLNNCSSSTIPSSLNANTIRARTQVLRNGVLQILCDTGTVFNSGGQGIVSATKTCNKTSTADSTWKIFGAYGWYDFDDTTWRSEIVIQPVIVD